MSEEVKSLNVNLMDSQVTLVSKDYLFDGMILPTNVYLRLTENSYIHIGIKGTSAQFSQLKSYQNNQSQVFVLTKEKSLLMDFISSLTNKIITNDSVAVDRKALFIQELVEDTLEGVVKSNFASLDRMQSVGNLLVKLSKQIPNIDKAIEIMQQQKNTESRHPMTTCLISMMIAEEAGVLSPLNQDKLAAGALLHDVGLRFVDESILNRPRETWSLEELSLYEQHPIKGAEMLRRVEGMSVEVLLIIAEHHENAIGTGFPKKIRDVRMNPLSKIVALANCFTELILSESSKSYTPDEAIQYIDQVLGQPFNKGLFSNLKNIINSSRLEAKIKKAS